ASGGNSRVSATVAANWMTSLKPWAPNVTKVPRSDRRRMSFTKWSVRRCGSPSGGFKAELSACGGLREVPFVGLAKPVLQRGLGRPAHAPQPLDVDHLARRAVGLGTVQPDRAGEPHDPADERRQVADGDLLAGAEIDDRLVRVVLHQEDHAVGRVVHMQELAERVAAAP